MVQLFMRIMLRKKPITRDVFEEGIYGGTSELQVEGRSPSVPFPFCRLPHAHSSQPSTHAWPSECMGSKSKGHVNGKI